MIDKILKDYKKTCLLTAWFISKNIVIFLNKILGEGINNVKVVSGFEIEIKVLSKNIYPLIFFLNKHTLCQFKIMVDIICYDIPGKKNRFSIVYNLLSIKNNMRLRVLSKASKTEELLSLVSLYNSVNWSEREIFDFFGVFFFENRDLRRILTDYGFKGYPLRKDFPLTGYVDVYYDDNQKRICYRTLELSQEYRNFNFKSTWRFDV